MNAEQIMNQLKNPFHPDDIEWRVGSTTKDKTKGLALAYITNRAIQNRLDEVFGVFGWRNEFKEWKGVSQLCGISVKFEGEWITKWDGADDSATEAVKGGLSDSMKRAAYQWGIGRYLYKLPQTWVKLKPQGNSYAIDQVVNLPAWALPSDYKQQQTPTTTQQPKPNTNISPIPQKPVQAKYEGIAGEYQVNFSKYKGKLSGMEHDMLLWVASEYKGADKQLQGIAKRYLQELEDDKELDRVLGA